jgi:oligopeptide/dipeptide ABC transporter ATP-binding protein
MFDTDRSEGIPPKLAPLNRTATPLLAISDLNVVFPSASGPVQASDGVNLNIDPGGSLCLVGESGCGKSIVALSIMRLLPANACLSGRIEFKGRNLLDLPPDEMRKLRGRKIAMIFEQPTSCLNPVLKIGKQIAEAVQCHQMCSRKVAKERAIELMSLVGLPSPKKRYRQYPHEFSGGMIQRAMIALSLASRPDLLIADEPTTSLDVTIQAQIIDLLKTLIERFNTTLLLITHDLNVAAELGAQAAVMYAGSIVECGPLPEVMGHPRHPYTQALVRAAAGDDPRLLDGAVAELSRLPNGCRFHPRCPRAETSCAIIRPPLKNGLCCHVEA